ncbi:MAG: FtsK/SpoIIIE domain-containing protein [Actinomycetaceae bacterium]|nr:FtsK/SpoIIIE domain-containing protein [Actinomycetaceae bacterium]
MLLSIQFDGATRRIDLTSHTERATFMDLLEEATGFRPDPQDAVWVDEREYRCEDRLSAGILIEGSTISTQARPVPGPVYGWSMTELSVDGVGRSTSIQGGQVYTIGRSPQCTIRIPSASASWSHAAAELASSGLRVRDLGSTNGTRVDGSLLDEDGVELTEDATMRVGSSIISIRKDLAEEVAPRPGALRNVTASGTVPFNRPPRPSAPPPPEKVQPPVKRTVHKGTSFSVAMFLGPLIMAGVMIAVMRDIRYVLFALLSPVVGFFSMIEQKRRKRKEEKEAEEEYAAGLETFKKDIAAQVDRVRAQYIHATPDIELVRRRAALPATTLWQRRTLDSDFLLLSAGVGDVPWKPELENRSSGRQEEAITEILESTEIGDAPVHIDLSNAGVVGIVGQRPLAVKIARSLLVQAAVHCGPADLSIGIFHDPGRAEEWEWTTWLPHTRSSDGGGGARLYSGEREPSEAMLRTMRENLANSSGSGYSALLLIDSDVLLEGRDAPARALMGLGRNERIERGIIPPRVSGIVIAPSIEYLPAACTAVIEVKDSTSASLHWPGERTRIDSFSPMGLSVEDALETAKDLAHFEDPEQVLAGAGLPSLVRMNPLLGLEEVNAEEIIRLWSSSKGISTPVGTGHNGAFTLDLVKDGPHGLVGGTTGSGKSEFLRTLVAGLAARNSPEKLTFILIDFKGGAAFATCERLPHTIGTVSNLEAQLADRALRALEAEMNYRQRLFAEAGEGVDNLDAYLATKPEKPLPRLLLVVDEFAMLAKEYPDVLSSLVSVAAVGRTLGVHMILATQRPAGVVNDDILANTNLRVALRVQSRDDSQSVIGVPDAAAIGRAQRGRAWVKLGQDDITAVQTALVTGQVEGEAVQPVTMIGGVGALTPATSAPRGPSAEDETDLDVLIDAIVAANNQVGLAPPRPVWPEPLGERIHLKGFPKREGEESLPEVGSFDGDLVEFAISDDPDRQQQISAGWRLQDGNLLLVGMPGYGTTTALASIGLSICAHADPQDVDLLILDMGANELRSLQALPHCVGYVGTGPGAAERRARFIKHLRAELDRRRSQPGPHRSTVILLDGFGALRDEYKDSDGLDMLDLFYRVYQDGPDLGLHFAISTSRAKSIPSPITEVTEQKYFFLLSDRYDYSNGGLKPENAPSPVPGRAVNTQTTLQTHIATPAAPLDIAVEHVRDTIWPDSAPKRELIGQLPSEVRIGELGTRGKVGGDPWLLPIGIAEADLEPALLESYEGEHILIAGPPRSGKSLSLLALAEVARRYQRPEDDLQVWGICNRRSPLANSDLDRLFSIDEGTAAIQAAMKLHDGPLLLLVDDAERVTDSGNVLLSLVTDSSPHIRVAAAGRNDDIRSIWSQDHWLKAIRRSRCGILLQPNVDQDSDLLSVRIPRRAPVAMMAGRGYLCLNGSANLVQVALPSTTS